MTKWLPKWVLAVSCVLAPVCSAQTVQPIIQPHQTFVDLSGNPCSGCKLYSYAAGTTTPQATYVDSAGIFQNTNPIVLDAAGGANIWIGQSAYKFALLDTYGTTLWTVDNVLAPSPSGQGPFLPLAGGTMNGAIAMATNNITNAGTISAAIVNGTTINGTAENLSGILTDQANVLAQSNLVLGTEGVDDYLEIFPAVYGQAIFYVDNSGNTLRIGNGGPGNIPLTYDVAGNLVIPGLFRATTVDAALNGSLGATTPNAISATTGTFSGALQAAGIIGTSIIDSSVISAPLLGTDSSGKLIPATNGVDEYFTATGCTIAASTDNFCTGTVTLPTAMADTSYYVFTQANVGGGSQLIYMIVNGALTINSFPYILTCTFNCTASISPTIYVHAHHN